MKTIKLDTLIENPDNPQTVTDEAFADLCKSIERDEARLELRPIAFVTDYETADGTSLAGKRVVIDGNKRLRALKKIRGNSAALPAKYFYDMTPCSLEERKRWLVRANIQSGEWDAEALAKLYTADELADITNDKTLAELLASAEAAETEGKTDADDIPEVNTSEPPKSVRGEIYQLGNHRLMCGDSTSKADVARLVQGGGADLLLTDPPYNVNYKGKAGKIANDNMKSEEFRVFLIKALSAANSVLKPGAAFYVWYASSSVIDFASAVNAVGWKTHEELIWVKDSLVLGRCDYQMRHEPCLYGWKVGEKHLWRSDRRQTSVIDLVPEHIVRDGDTIQFYVAGRLFQCSAQTIFEVVDGTVIPVDKPTANKSHPTMKPVALFTYQIRNSSKPGAYVLDLFGGSGTTLIACEKTHRNCRMMELDPHYCDVIRRRWAEFVNGEGCDWESLTPAIENPETLKP